MNENPFLPPDNVIKAAEKGLKEINRYSNIKNINKLRELIALYCNTHSNRVVVSQGSEFLLREVIQIFSHDRKIIMVNPSFFPALYYAKEHAKKLVKVQLSPPKFELNSDVILKETNEPSILIIDNPNNPTGSILFEKNAIKELLENKQTLVLVDEAYYEFYGKTALDLVNEYPNLAIIRSMDKSFSLAGLRVGYLVGGNIFLEKMSDFQPFISQPAVYAAIESLKDTSYMESSIKKIINERNRVEAELKNIGYEVFPSNTNFLLFRSNIPDLGLQLMEYEIIIRDLSNDWLNGFYRVSIGLPEENEAFLDIMNKLLK